MDCLALGWHTVKAEDSGEAVGYDAQIDGLEAWADASKENLLLFLVKLVKGDRNMIAVALNSMQAILVFDHERLVPIEVHVSIR